jgi:hypothetical protein
MVLEIVGGVFVVALGLLFAALLLLRASQPFTVRCIRSYCEAQGCTEVEVKSWSNHYGVSLVKSGSKHYLRCRGILRNITWLGSRPEQL